MGHDTGTERTGTGRDTQLAAVEGLAEPRQQEIDATIRRTREAFALPSPLELRLDRLDRLEAMLTDREELILAALADDLGKSATEAWVTEIGTVVGEIAHLRKLLPSWTRPRKAPSSASLAPSRAWTERQPLGTVLIMAPWNYPVQLVLSPLAGALAAGNTAVVKPSEVAPAVAEVLADGLREFLGDCVGVVQGGIPETTRVLQHRFDHIFYTGNATVGRIVMRAAAEYLTPVTLELGGKSPVWVDGTVDLAAAASRIAWGKFVNAGQTCVAPDYVMGPAEVLTALEPLLVSAISRLYGPDPVASDSYGRIVTAGHLERLTGLLDRVKAQDLVTGGSALREERYLAPTVIRSASDGPFMREEIFGPVLPLVPVEEHREAIEVINASEKPLALYVLSEDETVRAGFRETTSSGGMAFGAPLVHLAHPHLPFGGVGESGTGNYHGEYSLKTFTHERAVLDKPVRPDTLKIIYPPYTALKARGARLALGLPSPARAIGRLLGRRS